jgi:DEAD/DEAH box helicase domain-containing protein
MKITIYDAEIKNAIPPGFGWKKHPDRNPDIEYCAGWDDFENMGISVICACVIPDGTFRVFMDDNMSEFEKLILSSDLIAGFNSESFDDKLCQANGIEITTGYDILRETYRAKGLEPYPDIYTSEYKGHGLDAIAKANGLKGKIGNGALAPVWWQQGQIGSVIDYCLHDVNITAKLFMDIIEENQVVDPVTGLRIWLRNPVTEEGA